MRILREPEHVELRLVPAADNVEAEAAPADVIGRDDLLRCEHLRKERHMHGAEHSEALGGGQQAARPGDRFKRATLEIGRTAIALPAPDRHHGFDAGRIRHLREPDIVLEGVLPAFRHCSRGTAARAVGAEDGQLEPITADHGGIALDLHNFALPPPLRPPPPSRGLYLRAPLLALLYPSVACLSSPSNSRAVPRSAWLRAALVGLHPS